MAGKRWRRIGAVLVVSWLAFVALVAALTARLFIWPPASHPQRADAVVVLSGDPEDLRLHEALRLIRQGVAPTLVISNGDPTWVAAIRLCRTPQPFPVACVQPRPVTTRGEARTISRYAAGRGWRRLVIVTTKYHQTRAGLLFRRCFHRSTVVGVKAPRGSLVRPILHEWAGLLDALTLARGC